MEIEAFSELLRNLSIALLAVSPTVFVFSVTLLGTAIERAREEEKAARENVKVKVKTKIQELKGSLEAAEKDGNTTDLRAQLEVLKKEEEDAEAKVREIKIKYTSIDFNNTVLYPCSAFLFVLILSLSNSYFSEPFIEAFFFIGFAECMLIAYGVGKLYWSLRLVQEISTGKKESEQRDLLSEAFKQALREVEQDKTVQAEVTFSDKVFPLSVSPGTDLKIDFKVSLKKGNLLKEAKVYFYVPDGFELVSPPESESWKQSSDFSSPNIRTVSKELGTLSVGTRTPSFVKVKTPLVPNKYLLRYAVYGEGFSSGIKDLVIIVG